MAEALRLGASDYLCDPWTEAELAARVGRLLPKTVLELPRIRSRLTGTRLQGPSASVNLSLDESALFRILYREAGDKVSRTALRRLLWPLTSDGSRIVDETVSRLRARLDAVGISRSRMNIRSVRGFGYVLEILN